MDFPKGTPCQFFFWIAAIFALFWRATPPKKGEERYFSSGNPSSRSFYSPLKGAGGPVGMWKREELAKQTPIFLFLNLKYII